MFFLHPNICIEAIPQKGNGIIAKQAIVANTIVEVSPVIVLNAAERKLIDQTLLHDYIFVWGDAEDQCCMAQGYISIYNHSTTANCEYEMDFTTNTIKVFTLREIAQGEELTFNYNGDWNNKEAVWFMVKE